MATSPISVRLFSLKDAQKLKNSRGKQKSRFEVIGLDDPNKKYRISCEFKPYPTIPKESCFQKSSRRSGFSRFAWLKVASPTNIPFYIKVNIASLRKRFNIQKQEIKEALKKSADLTEVLQKRLIQIKPLEIPLTDNEVPTLIEVPKIKIPEDFQDIPVTKDKFIEETTNILKELDILLAGEDFKDFRQCKISRKDGQFLINFWEASYIGIGLTSEKKFIINGQPANEFNFSVNFAAYGLAFAVYQMALQYSLEKLENNHQLEAARLAFHLAIKGFKAVKRANNPIALKEFFVRKNYVKGYLNDDSETTMIKMVKALSTFAATGDIKSRFSDKNPYLPPGPPDMLIRVDYVFQFALRDELSFRQTLKAISEDRANSTYEIDEIALYGETIYDFLQELKEKKLF